MKAVSLYRPNTIHNALSDFDRYFESFFGDNLMSPVTRAFNHLPAVDVRETERSYVMDMELPGYDEKDIEIHIDGSNLSIVAKRENAAEKKEENAPTGDAAEDQNVAKDQGVWLLRERRTSSVSRSFKLPQNADPEEVTAVFKNGILTLEVKKRAEAQKRTIQIKAA